MQRFHYFPTDATALCGQSHAPGVVGTGDRIAFFAHYANGTESHCHKCVRVMRRWADFRADLVQADKARALALGFTT